MLSSSNTMRDPYEELSDIVKDLKFFFADLGNYLGKNLHLSFLRFEKGKGVFVEALYKERGKYVRRFIHSAMASLAGAAVVMAPVIAKEFPGRSVNPWEIASAPSVLSATIEEEDLSTSFSDTRGGTIKYIVQEGDSVSTIAEKFGISADTIRWQNDLKSKAAIKTGAEIEILPISGVSHKVKKGDTVYSIAKVYDVDPQEIVNYPFNTYVNDETFELAIGQNVIVPNGIKSAEVLWQPLARVKQITPDAGTVVASGQFVWPASGTISQNFVWYHPGLDIANKSAPAILAADSGTIITAGWPDGMGYGNRVVIDHGNGTKTLYAHLSRIFVVSGQSVRRGDQIGQMGSTGRSTGTHLHFEIIQGGRQINPLGVLR